MDIALSFARLAPWDHVPSPGGRPRAQPVPGSSNATPQNDVERMPPGPPRPGECPGENRVQEAAAGDQRGIPEWQASLGQQGLSQDTVARLGQHGFLDNTALAELQDEDLDTIGVQPLAQRRVLSRIVRQLNRTLTGATPRNGQETGAAPTHLPDSIGELFARLPTTPALQQQEAVTGENLDPLSFLLPRQRRRHLDIVDFVQMGSVGEETTLSSGEGAEVVIKSGPRKPKLEAVSPMQWSAANIRILLEMLTSGSLKQSSMFDYLGSS